MPGSAEDKLSPKRKQKQLLTFIPEEDRPISYRFTVIVVGKPCKDFALRAVESEMAEAYKPGNQAKARAETSDAGPDRSGSHPTGEADQLDASSPAHTPHRDKEDDKEKDKMILFCPTGLGARELVRLRFKLCAGFSDAMPLSTDRTIAASIFAVLLFWRVCKGPTAGEDEMSTDDTINDWRSRMAEINHKPAACRPYVVVLAFGADEKQEEAVNAFVKQQSIVKVNPTFYEDDSEETFMESLQTTAEEFIKWQANNRRSLATMGSTQGNEVQKSSKFCNCTIA